MKPLVLLTLLSLISGQALAQRRGVYRAPRPRPPATAGTLERDPVTGNYRLTYTDEEGQSYTITVQSRDRVVFELLVDLSADKTYTALNYSYQLRNTATSPEATRIFLLALVPCDDPGATVSSGQWTSEVGMLEYISARRCEFSALKQSQLAPGARLTDAKVTSRWLPGIGRAIVSGAAAPPVWPSGEATPTAAYDLAETVNDAYLGGKKLETLVPLKDPARFATPDRGLGLVLADLSQACSLGWFNEDHGEHGERGREGKRQRHEREHDHDDDGICNSLAKKLAQAQSAVLNRDFRLAGKRLRAVRKELSERRQDEDGADPAFTLLDTNVGYVRLGHRRHPQTQPCPMASAR